MKTGRILSGMRPTGRLHLGNYVGALENWVRLQDEGWQNFHMVADWHMLTTGYEDTSRLQADIHEMVVDWLAAGLDPEKSVIFIQSEVKEHAELHLLFSMLVSKARLERIRDRGGSPFMDDQVPRAVIRFKQGFGRLIRSTSDTGRVVVLDPRLVTKPYGRCFLEALPEGVEPEYAEPIDAEGDRRWFEEIE